MSLIQRFCLLIMATMISCTAFADDSTNIPILCYHNFNPVKPGYMNMKPQTFETQIKWLKDNGFHIVALKDAVEYLQGKRASLPTKSIVITFDDGWASVDTYLLPIVQKYNFPVTLFIYPETISHGKNALTWDQLKKLQRTGMFDIQSHTYWHPNFKQEKKKRSQADFDKFVKSQLVNSKKILDEKLGINVTLLAWPFGIYDAYLEQQAADAGYVMAFSIDDAAANKHYKPMAQPRFMILETQTMKTFVAHVNTANAKVHA